MKLRKIKERVTVGAYLSFPVEFPPKTNVVTSCKELYGFVVFFGRQENEKDCGDI